MAAGTVGNHNAAPTEKYSFIPPLRSFHLWIILEVKAEENKNGPKSILVP